MVEQRPSKPLVAGSSPVSRYSMERKPITPLREDVIHKIAAGEVIERPASCVKELVENSIDAEATHITVRVKGGGIDFIEVIDNGYGIPADQVELAIESHTTSKINDISDLDNLTSLGFRGEALASIRRVADMEIITRAREEPIGTYLRVDNTRIVDKRQIARNVGTTVKVYRLFERIPARRKFLKSKRTEFGHILGKIYNYAIAYPEIGFKLVHDDEVVLDLMADELEARLTNLLGEEFMSHLEPFEVSAPNILVWGYVSRPEMLDTHPEEFIFVNRRPVRSHIIRKAVQDAYGLDDKSKHPSFVIFIELDPTMIDVNIHPRKDEVRFSDERSLYNFIVDGIRNKLRIKLVKGFARPAATGEGELTLEGTRFWQLHNSYIFAQTKQGLIIVDQHAAHERIIYEQLLKSKPTSRRLMFPVVANLTPREYEVYKATNDLLTKFGFDIEEFGHHTVKITAVPGAFEDFDTRTFKEMLLELDKEGKLKRDIEIVGKTIACKAATKAKQELTSEEMNALIDRLFATQNPFFCPHGRPTLIRITLKELAKRFARR